MDHTINICGDDVITMQIPETECDACDELIARIEGVEEVLADTAETAQEALSLAESLEGMKAYANVDVGGVLIPASTHDDTIGFVAGQNIALTPNQIDGTITISATESGETLENVKDADGTRAVVGNDVNVNTATGDYSTAFGTNTTASGDNQFVVGKYNVNDLNDEFAFIVGNGTDGNTLKNAFAIDWSGQPLVRGLPGLLNSYTYSKSCTNATDVDITSIMTASYWGVFIGFIYVNFPANATGRRGAVVLQYHASSTATTETNSRFLIGANSAQQTRMTLPVIMSMHANDRVELRVYQNSGSAMTVSGTLTGMFIRAN